MVHWIYVLKCEDDRIYVGETTKLFKRLYKHVNGQGAKCTKNFEPYSIIGIYNLSKNISFENYKDDNNLIKLSATFNIDWQEMYRNELSNLDIENYITECFMQKMGDKWWKVRGGKYTKLITDDCDDFSCVSSPNCENNTCNDCVFYISKRKEMMDLGPIEKPMVKLINCKKPIINVDRPSCFCGYPGEINMYNGDLYYNCPLKNANKWIDFEDLDLEPNCNFYKKYHDDFCIL